MSALAKVLVVLNLVLTLFFLGVSATVFTTNKSWVEESKTQTKQYTEALAGQVKVIKDKSARVDSLSSDLAARTKDIEKIQGERNDLANQKSDLVAERAKLSSEIDELEDRLAQKDRALEQRDNEITQLRDSKDKAIADADRAGEDKKDAELRLARAMLDKQKLQEEYESLASVRTSLAQELEEKTNILTAATRNGVDLTSLVGIKPAPAIDGVVAAYSKDVGLLVLTVGADDQVQPGHEFTIYRGGEFIGKAKVHEVTPDMAGARLIFTEAGKEIRVGDKATTRMGGN